MKTFRYSCRDKNGGTKQGEMKSASRADVLRELSAQGNIPLSITETSGVGHGQHSNLLAHSKKIFFVLIALGIVLICGLLWKPFTKQGDKAGQLRTAKNAAKKTEAIQKKQIAVTPVVTQLMVSASATNLAVRGPKTPASVADVIAMNANTNQVGKLRPTPSFNMAAESVMSMLLHGSPGMPGPPIPRIPNLEKRFMDCLSNNVVLYDTDSEEMAKQKEQVALLKLEFAEYMKQGYTASNIVAAIQEQRTENVKLRRDLRAQMMELYNAGQVGQAEKYRDEANAYLSEKRLPLITLPKPRQ